MRISRAQPIFSGKKKRHDAHSVETLYIFTPPQSVCSNICTPAWKQGNCIWERGNPFPVRLGAAAPRPCARRFATLTASLPSFPRENSRSFGVQKCFRALLGALSTFKSIFVTSPMRFRLSGALPEPRAARFRASGLLPRLSRHIFSLWERSHDFHGAFTYLGSVPTTSPAHFHASGAFPRLPRRVFSLRERSVAAQCAAYRVFLRKTRAVSAFGSAPSQRGELLCLSGAARMLTPALSARGAEIIQNLFIRRMNHGRDGSCKGKRQGARDGA